MALNLRECCVRISRLNCHKMGEPTLMDIMNKLNKLDEINTTSKQTNDKLTAFMDETNNQISTLNNKCATNESRIKLLEEKIASLENRSSIAGQVVDDELCKQQRLANNVCVHGIPVGEKENVSAIIQSLGVAIKMPVQPDDIIGAYRTKGKQEVPGLIIVKFKDFSTKFKFMKAKKDHRKLIASDLNLNLVNGDREIYLNNHLTPFFANLLMKCRKSLDKFNLKSCWVTSSGLCCLTKDNERLFVKNELELYKLEMPEKTEDSEGEQVTDAGDDTGKASQTANTKGKGSNGKGNKRRIGADKEQEQPQKKTRARNDLNQN